MSTGDWFSLRPLNFNLNSIEERLANVETRLSNLEILTNNLNTSVSTIETRLYNVEQFADTINVNLLNLTQQVNAMNQTISNLSNSINNIVDTYKPIMGFTFNLIHFTDGSGNTANGSMFGAWYRPIRLVASDISNAGVDLKYLLLAIRGINISPMTSGVFYFSDPMALPIPPVNNNDKRVFWSSAVPGHEMNTREAQYYLNLYGNSNWNLVAMNRDGPGIDNDSAWFIVGYY